MKKTKMNWAIWGVLILAVVLLIYFFAGGMYKTLKEHGIPADISKGESGTGMTIEFMDNDGNLVTIPDWFSTSSIIPLGEFSIVRRQSPPTCSVVSTCPGYVDGVGGSPSDDYIMCWNSKCVLGNIALMRVGFTVQNPSTSQVTFLNVAPSSASPASLNTALNKTAISSLSPGSSYSWQTDWISVAQFEGQQPTFSITAQGTNSYTREISSASDSIILVFEADPTGSLSVIVSNPAP